MRGAGWPGAGEAERCVVVEEIAFHDEAMLVALAPVTAVVFDDAVGFQRHEPAIQQPAMARCHPEAFVDHVTGQAARVIEPGMPAKQITLSGKAPAFKAPERSR